MAKYFSILTNLGAGKLANAAALGTKLEMTHIAVGDGGGVSAPEPTPDPAMTDLLGEKRRAAINSLSIDPLNPNQIIVEQVIPETDGGFWIREIGLFDKAGTLIAYSNCAGSYKPQLQEGSGRALVIRMILIVSSTEAVSLKIDPSVVLATRKYVDSKVAEDKTYTDKKMSDHRDDERAHPDLKRMSRSCSVSFMFDDALVSVFDLVAPLFNSYGYKFGVAVPYQYLTGGNRLTTEQLIAINNSGNEVINHATSGDAMLSAESTSLQKVRGEIGTCWSALKSIGIETIGFQTPSSVMNDELIKCIPEFCQYAFTKASKKEKITKGTDVYNLWRFSLESESSSSISESLSELNASGCGAIVFYAHDIKQGSVVYDRLIFALNYCKENGINVLTPFQCISSSISPLGARGKTFTDKKIIDSGCDEYSVIGSQSTIEVSNDGRDLRLTLTPDSESLVVQKRINFSDDSIALDELYTLSMCIRKTQNSFRSCSIGLKMYSDKNLEGDLIYKVDEQAFEPSNYDIRYFVSACPRGKKIKSMLVYVRFNGVVGGGALIRDPVLRVGTSLEKTVEIVNERMSKKFVIPVAANTMSPTGSSWADFILSNSVIKNSLISLTDGKTITFNKSGVFNVDLSLVTSGGGSADGVTSACVQYVLGSYGAAGTRPFCGDKTLMVGGTGVTAFFSKGDTLRFRYLVSGGVLVNSEPSSRLLVNYIE